MTRKTSYITSKRLHGVWVGPRSLFEAPKRSMDHPKTPAKVRVNFFHAKKSEEVKSRGKKSLYENNQKLLSKNIIKKCKKNMILKSGSWLVCEYR